MRRKTAPFVAVAAAAAVVTNALHVRHNRLDEAGLPEKQGSQKSIKNVKLTVTPASDVSAKKKKDLPTAAPDHVEQNEDADLVTDTKTHDEAHRYEAAPPLEPPVSPHAHEQAKLAKDGYRPHPDPPQPFIDATCEEICQSDCATEGLGQELESSAESHSVGVPHAIEDGFGYVGDYFKDIFESIVPAMNLHFQSGTVGDNKKNIKSSDNQNKVKNDVSPSRSMADQMRLLQVMSSTKKSSIVLKTSNVKNIFKKDSSCVAKCQAQLDACADQIDSSDSIPEVVEEYTTVPQRSHCADVAKLRFIAESGNLKWSMRFGQSPTFSQLASLAAPHDVITQADLKVLAHCAEGGNFAGLNLGGAIGLASCMVNEVHDYANAIKDGIILAHKGDADNKVPDPTMNPAGVVPVVADDKGEFHMGEEIFYINDLRCFSSCPGVKLQGLLESCESGAHCASDFADLLWRTGTLYSPTTMGNAVNDMGYAHATDPATLPRSLIQRIFAVAKADPALKPGEELPGTADPAVAAKNAKADHAHPPAAPSPLSPAEDPTSPVHPRLDGPNPHTPPFCKMQMCAPYPSTWIHGDLLHKLLDQGSLTECKKVDPLVPDVHPNDMYHGAFEDPQPPASAADKLLVISRSKKPSHPIMLARKKALERRRTTWAWNALKASGYKGNSWPVQNGEK